MGWKPKPQQGTLEPVIANCMHQQYDACMKNLQIRNVPEQTHAILRRRAAEAGQSLQEYLLDLVRQAASRPTVAEVMKRAGGRTGGRAPLAEVAAEIRKQRTAR